MTLVTLAGDDLNYLTPIIYEFKEKITNHILVYDDALHKLHKAKQLQNGLERLKNKYSLNCKLHAIRIDEDSKNDMMRVFMQIKMIENDVSSIFLHSTEGYAALALILSNLVLNELGSVLTYDLLDNEYHLIQGTTLITKPIENSMDLEDYLLMMNNTLLEQKTKEHLLERKPYIQSLFSDYSHFAKVKKALVEQDSTFDYSYHRNIMDNLHALGIVDDKHIFLPSMQMSLQGELFEEYIFLLCEPLGFDDIGLGVKIDFDQIQKPDNPSHRIKNEFDILMIKENRIFTIECKLSNNLEGLSLIYKYDTIMDYFGKDAKAILLNISNKEKSPYLNTKRSSIFNEASLRRAIMSKMHVYHESRLDPIKFTNLVKSFFI